MRDLQSWATASITPEPHMPSGGLLPIVSYATLFQLSDITTLLIAPSTARMPCRM